jgi:hypothetical protein
MLTFMLERLRIVNMKAGFYVFRRYKNAKIPEATDFSMVSGRF